MIRAYMLLNLAASLSATSNTTAVYPQLTLLDTLIMPGSFLLRGFQMGSSLNPGSNTAAAFLITGQGTRDLRVSQALNSLFSHVSRFPTHVSLSDFVNYRDRAVVLEAGSRVSLFGAFQGGGTRRMASFVSLHLEAI